MLFCIISTTLLTKALAKFIYKFHISSSLSDGGCSTELLITLAAYIEASIVAPFHTEGTIFNSLFLHIP